MSRAAKVTVIATKGSTPRDVGASMVVYADYQTGTIGGGALELAASRAALAGFRGESQHALGPSLGQCCGGHMTLLTEDFDAAEAPEGTAVWIWGAGHVGRAIVHMLAPCPGFTITWVDTAADRFPNDVPEGVATVPAKDPALLMPRAPETAQHFILTYSHAMDLALCDAALRRGFATCGVIGSATKWARFRSRLSALGHQEAEISRIRCPIGQRHLGKHPSMIAVGVVHGLVSAQTTGDIL